MRSWQCAGSRLRPAMIRIGPMSPNVVSQRCASLDPLTRGSSTPSCPTWRIGDRFIIRDNAGHALGLRLFCG